MAEQQNKGILIDVGFNADVNSLISNINSELKKARFGDYIDIDTKLIKQLDNVAKKIREINSIGWDNKSIDSSVQEIKDYSAAIKELKTAQKNIKNTQIGFSDVIDIDKNQINEDFNYYKAVISDMVSFRKRYEKEGSWEVSYGELNNDNAYENLREYSQYAEDISKYTNVLKNGKIKIPGIDVGDFEELRNQYKTEIDYFLKTLSGEDDASIKNLEIPISIKLTTDDKSLLEQVQTIVEASRNWMDEHPIRAKIEVDTGYQSQKIREDLKTLKNNFNSFKDDPQKLEKEIAPTLEDLGERFSRGLEIKLNKENFEDDAAFVLQKLNEIRQKILNINNLHLKPKVSLGEEEIPEFEERLKKLGELLETDGETTVQSLDKLQKAAIFENTYLALDELSKKIIELGQDAKQTKLLVEELKTIKTLLKALASNEVSNTIVKNIKSIKTALTMDKSAKTLFDILEKYKNDDFKNVGGKIKEFLGSIDFNEEMKLNAQRLGALSEYLSSLNSNKEIQLPKINFGDEALNSYAILDKLVENAAKTYDLLTGNNIDANKITGLSNVEDSKSAISSVTSEINQLDSLKLSKLKELIGELSKDIPTLNTTANADGIISVLNKVLSKEGAINALANLFSTGFSQKLNQPSSISAQGLEKTMKDSMLDEFYARAQQMPELLNKAFTGGQTGILEYTKGIEGLFDAYSTILGDRLNPQDGMINKEEYQAVKEYMSALVTDIQTQMSHVFDNLYATASPSLRRQLDLIRSDLVDTMPTGLTQEGDLEKAKQSLASYQEVVRTVNKTLSESQGSVLNSFYEKASKLPEAFNNVISNNSVANIKEYKDQMADILSLYQLLVEDSKRGNNRMFSKEEFSEAKAFLSGTIKEMNAQVSALTKNMTAGLSKNGKAAAEQELSAIKAIIPKNISDTGSIEDIGKVLPLLVTAQKKIDAFTAKSERAKQALSDLREKIKTVGTESAKTFSSGDTLGASGLIRDLLSINKQIVKVREAADNGYISEKAVRTTEARAKAIGSNIQKALTKALGENVVDVLPENAISNMISEIAITGTEDAADKLKTMFKTLRQKVSEDAKASKIDIPIEVATDEKSLVDRAKKIEGMAMKLQRLQAASFKGDDETLYHFLELLKLVDEEFIKLKQDEAEFLELSEKDSVGEVYDKLSTNISNVYNKLKQGFTEFNKAQKGTPINSQIVNLSETEQNLGGLFNRFGIKEEIGEIELQMNAARENVSKLFADSNVMVNGLAFSKLLGKIYNDMANNSNMSAELKKRYQNLADEMESRGATNTSKTQFDAYAKSFQNLNSEMKRTGQTGKNFFSLLKSNMASQTAQLLATTFSFYRLIFVFKQGVQEATEFNTALTKISYTMDVSDEELNKMGGSILKLSKELKTSVTSMEQIYTIYANMNTSSAEVEELSKYTAVLSNLAGMDASTAADDIQAVVNQFENLSSADTKHIVDVFDYISRNISVDYSKGIEGMAEGVQAVGNVADQAGLSYEQLSSIIAKTMEQTRNSGSSIANGLKTIMVRLSKASTMDDEVDNSTLSKASAVLHDIGVEVYTAEGEFREFDTIMTELAAKWDHLTEAQQANISFQIAATRQTATLKAILSNWTDSMDLATEATDANGNALENQDKYAETYAARMQEMKNAFSELAITFSESELFDDSIKGVESLTQALSGLLGKIGLIPTAVATISLSVVLKELKTFKNTVTSLPSLGKALSAGKAGLADQVAKYGARNEVSKLMTGSFDDKSITAYAMSLDGLSKQQAKVAVTTSALSDAEKEAVLARYAEQQATLNLSAAEFETLLVEKGVRDEDIKTIATNLAASGSVDTLTEARIREALSIKAVDEELKEEIVTQVMSNTTSVASVGIIGKLKEAWTGLAGTVGLTGGQLAAVVAAITVAYFAFKKLSELNVTFDEYKEGLDEVNKSAESSASELKDLNDELQTSQDRLRELQTLANQGKISITDKEELENLKAENIELEKKIANQKILAEEDAKKALEEAKEDPSHGYNANVISSQMGNTLYYDTTTFDDINDAVKTQLEALYLATSANVDTSGFESELNEQLQIINGKIDAYENYINVFGELSEDDQVAYNKLRETYKNIMEYKYDSTGSTSYYDVLDDATKIEKRYQDVYNRIKGMQSDVAYADEQFTQNLTDEIIRKANVLNGVKLDGVEIDLTSADFNFKDIILPEDFSEMNLDEKADAFVNAWREAVKRQFDTEELGIIDVVPTFEDAWLGLENLESDDPLKDLKENLGTLAEAGRLTEKSFHETVGADTWLDEINLSVEEVIDNINALYSDVDRLSGLKADVSALREAYGEKKDNIKDKEKPNAVGADTLAELEERFGKVTWTDETGAVHEKELESWKKYKEVAGSTTTTLKQLKKATDDLLTEFYNEGDYLDELVDDYGNVDDAAKDYYVGQLKEMGIANAEEVIEIEILNRQREAHENIAKSIIDEKAEKLSLKMVTDEDINAIAEEIAKNDELGISLDRATQLTKDLIAQKLISQVEGFGTDKDLSYLQKVIDLLGEESEAAKKAAKAQLFLTQANELAKIGNGSTSAVDGLRNQAQTIIDSLDEEIDKEVKTKYDDVNTDMSTVGTGSGSSSSSSSSNTKQKEWFDWIERKLTRLQDDIDLTDAKLENLFTAKDKHPLLQREIADYDKMIKAYSTAYQKYMEKANKYAKKSKRLTPELVSKIQNGQITGPTSQLIQQFGEKTANAINNYKDWFDKAQQALEDQQKAITSRREKVIEDYQNFADEAEAKANLYASKADDENRSYKQRNKYINKELKQLKIKYRYDMLIAKEEHDITKQRQIQQQYNEDVLSRRIQKIQNRIDARQGWADYRETQGGDYQRGYIGQNKALEKQKKLVEKIYDDEKRIAKINKDTALWRKLNVEEAQKLNEITKQEFDNIEKHFSNDTRAINDIISLNNAEVSLAEARGQKANVGYYQNNKKWQRTEYVNLTMEEKELRGKLKDLNSGSQEYADALNTLQGVIQSRIQMETDIANENNKIQQAYEDLYSTIASDTERISTELEFISSLFAHEKNTDTDVEGFFTEAGLANLDIYRTGIMTSQSNAQRYSERADILSKVLENPEKYARVDSVTGATEYIVETPFGEETFNSIEKMQTALNTSYDNVKTYTKEWYDYQTKIFDAVKERYETELAYVKELVDERKEALDAEKDLHDYQKTINEKTENITNLQRQISAYTGNSSEEGRARLQALQQQLKEAQEDLEETEYDRYISDQKQMLDDLYDEYEENIQEYLEKFYDRVDEGLNTINDSISNGFIDTVKALYGYNAQHNTDTVSDVSSTISSITERDVAQSGVNEKNFETTASVEDIINGLIASNSKFKYTGKKSKSEVSDVNRLIWDKLGKNFLLTGAGLQALAKALGVDYSDGLAKSSGALYKYLKNAGFSTGGIVTAVKKNGDDGLATLKNGEAVLTPLQTRQFSILVDNLSSLNKMVGSYSNLPNFEDIGVTANIENNCGGNTFTFELPNVTDSQSLLNELQSNTKIQKAIQSITIDQLMTQTKLKVKGIK